MHPIAPLDVDRTALLAFALQANKGAYAALLGSGLSHAAGISTGWEIVLDLCRRWAAAQGADPGDVPAAWFAAVNGALPDYAQLLSLLAPTPTTRQGLLSGYFESANEDERAAGVKSPTEAHRAIARLVAHGYLRVLITTNFDRLMERALEAEGITPRVVATPDAANGVPPLSQVPVLLLKVHGDYRDIRIKNTPEELSSYDRRIDRLLDRILDENGLLVCGWSGDWDEALRRAIERSPSRRYQSYWVARGEPRERATELVTLRGMQLIRVQDADTFFVDLDERVAAIEALGRSHPLSPAVGAERVKDYFESGRLIRLHDLALTEAERIHEATRWSL